MRNRIAGGLLVAALGAVGCATAREDTTPIAQTSGATNAASQQIFREQLRSAQALIAQQQWSDGRARLQEIAETVGPADPIGAEARSNLAQVAFELGDYPGAIAAGTQVPDGSPFQADALESTGLAQLFSCDFDGALESFFKLLRLDPARGHVWLGVAYAWTGADANAERELGSVVSQFSASPSAANARFYLVQLSLWRNRRTEAQQRVQALRAATPDYLPQLEARAANWLSRGTHLMRAYFTFDTLERVAILDRDAAAAQRLDGQAARALQGLQGNAGRCVSQVGRLAQARSGAAGLAQQLASEAAEEAARTRDTDGDGIPDRTDRCPNQAETRNGIQDTDGCPEETAAIDLVGNQIRIRDGHQFNFATGDDHVPDSSVGTVEQLAGLLNNAQYAWVRKIRLEGHTDDVGDAAANLDLSRRRVIGIAAALVSRGVDRNRLEMAWYGESRPLEPATTEDARARNRRVEITVTDPAIIGGVRAGP